MAWTNVWLYAGTIDNGNLNGDDLITYHEHHADKTQTLKHCRTHGHQPEVRVGAAIWMARCSAG